MFRNKMRIYLRGKRSTLRAVKEQEEIEASLKLFIVIVLGSLKGSNFPLNIARF